MVFSSLAFLYAFFPLTVLLYFAVPFAVGQSDFSLKWRNGVLLCASLIFYAWGEPKLVLMMLLATVIAYVGGLGIACFDGVQETLNGSEKSRRGMTRKLVFVITVALLIANLFVFKYFNFAVNNFAKLFRFTPQVAQIALPIGISFYTFQILSYVIDLYRGEIAVQKNFARLLLYVCLFPQLIAGPIVRYQTVEEELSGRSESLDGAYAGTVRFIAGLGKKVLLANNLALIAETIYAGDTAVFGSGAYWLAAIAYSLQIYFDFSGYSDMAIGMGRIFGFHFEENFNRPYLSVSVTEFWRRWHISLSSWFRDYVYIPLGGNRVSPARRIFNILAVWALTGLWHGAEWNFVLWGLYYGVLLIVEKTIKDWRRGRKEISGCSRAASQSADEAGNDSAQSKGGLNVAAGNDPAQSKGGLNVAAGNDPAQSKGGPDAGSEDANQVGISGKFAKTAGTILRWIITMFIVVVGWVLFNRNGMGQLSQTLGVMFSSAPTRWLDALRANSELLYGIVWLPAAVLTVAFERNNSAKNDKLSASASVAHDETAAGGNDAANGSSATNGKYAANGNGTTNGNDAANGNGATNGYDAANGKTSAKGIIRDLITMAWSLIILVLCLMMLLNSSYNPFIYFRF